MDNSICEIASGIYLDYMKSITTTTIEQMKNEYNRMQESV